MSANINLSIEPVEKKVQTLKKPSGSIYLSCDAMSKVSRKAFNYLLHNAAPNILENEVHTIPISTLKKRINTTSNFTFVKQILEKMATTKVTWNYIDRDQKDTWGVATLLGDAEVKDGILSYSYTPKMRTLLSNPSVYAILDLRSQDKLSLKYSIVLFEIATDWYREGDGNGETPWFTIDQFKTVMGVANAKAYKTFANLRKFIIEKPIQELNAETYFHLTYKLKKKGRKYSDIKFFITKNDLSKIKIIESGEKESIPPELLALIPKDQIADCNQVCHEILKGQGVEALAFYLNQTKDVDSKNKRRSWGATIRAALKRGDFDEHVKDQAEQSNIEQLLKKQKKAKENKEAEYHKQAKQEREERYRLIASLSEEQAIEFEDWLKTEKKKRKIHDGTKLLYIREFIETINKNTDANGQNDKKEPSLF